MADLQTLFNDAAKAAKAFNGSRVTYVNFFKFAELFEEAGGERPQVDLLLQEAIDAFYRFAGAPFLNKLKQGGTHIFEHDAVFIQPATNSKGVIKTGEGTYDGPIFEARLLEVIKLLQSYNIYTDDLVLDLGHVNDAQMRKKPYNILTILRLNAQIAIADQYGEAFFVANPLMEFPEWESFEKRQAGQVGSAYKNVQKIIRKGNWQNKLMDTVFKNDQVISNLNIQSQHEHSYDLDEVLIWNMAAWHKTRYGEFPTVLSGTVDPIIVQMATHDLHWQEETWENIDHALRTAIRGIETPTTLSALIEAATNKRLLTEEMVFMMAALQRENTPDLKWPTSRSGEVPRDIVQTATGDPHWPKEHWALINNALYAGDRGLSAFGSLENFFNAHKNAGIYLDTLREFIDSIVAENFSEASPKYLPLLQQLRPNNP